MEEVEFENGVLQVVGRLIEALDQVFLRSTIARSEKRIIRGMLLGIKSGLLKRGVVALAPAISRAIAAEIEADETGKSSRVLADILETVGILGLSDSNVSLPRISMEFKKVCECREPSHVELFSQMPYLDIGR